MNRATRFFGYRVETSDGSVWKLSDLYLDEANWTIACAVLDSTGALSGNRRILPAQFLEQPSSEGRKISVPLEAGQLEDLRQSGMAPVSERLEAELSSGAQPVQRVSARPSRKAGGGGAEGVSPALTVEQQRLASEAQSKSPLRSVQELTSYQIGTSDGPLGHLEDLMLTPDPWRVHYLLVHTRDWKPRSRVLVPPAWVSEINWSTSEVSLSVRKKKLDEAPRLKPGSQEDPGL